LTSSEFDEQGSSTSSNLEQTSEVTAAPQPGRTLVSSDDVLRAEVLWMLNVLTSKLFIYLLQRHKQYVF